MTSRQTRRERREAERKAKKAEYKRLKAEGAVPTPAPVESEPEIDAEPEIPAESDRRLDLSPETKALLRKMRERHLEKLERNGSFPPLERDLAPTSSKRLKANRQNAQLSTGPHSVTGKLASSRNSLKHGLASGELLIPGEDPAAFDSLLKDLFAEHQPVSATEELLVHEMAQAYWLEQRAIHFQNQCFTEHGINEHRLVLFLRYQTTHNRNFHKALTALSKLQKERRKLSRDEAALLSEPKTQENGFVSQQSAESSHENHFVRKNERGAAPNGGFVSQKSAPEPVPTFSTAAEAA